MQAKCPNCGGSHWENADHFRFKDKDKKGNKINMAICLDCGMVSYPDKLLNKEAMLEHYKKDYRPAPTINNSFTGQRKNYFHLAFLNDLFAEWKRENKNITVCDVGCAYGMSLNMIHQVFPDADINGVELTESMKRVCFHEFGYKLADEIDASKKYDMIMSYKVLEHQIDPMEELKKYATLLKQDGVLYISVPTWFNTMSNFGLDGFDLDYYYDPNHINVWTREMFESMLLRSGFEIIKQDHVIYGDTYLCKVKKENESLPVLKLEVDQVKSAMHLIKEAFLKFIDYKYEEATKIWPEYPQAWMAMIEMERKKMTEHGYEWFKNNLIKPMIDACPQSPECIITATDFALRANDFEGALGLAKVALNMKPNNQVSLNHIVIIFKELGIRAKTEEEKIKNFIQARNAAINLHNLSAQNREQAVNEIYFLNSLIPVGA